MNNVRLGVFILSILLISCKDSKDDLYKKGIIGKWLVVQSELNNKPSKSMDQAFFLFDSENKVQSNIFENTVDYKLEDKKLMIFSEEPLDMNIIHIDNDSLVMEGNYSMYFIKFFMTKDSNITDYKELPSQM
jgi:competence CoiA-like predicted nuclease